MKRYFLLTALIAGLFVNHNAHGMFWVAYGIYKVYQNTNFSPQYTDSDNASQFGPIERAKSNQNFVDNKKCFDALKTYKDTNKSIEDTSNFLIELNPDNLNKENKNFYNYVQSKDPYSLMPYDNSSGWQDNDNYRYKTDKNEKLKIKSGQIKFKINLYNKKENINLDLLLQEIETIEKMHPKNQKAFIKIFHPLIKEIENLKKIKN